MLSKAVLRFVIAPAGIKQSLGWNTADVQTGAAQCRLTLFINVFFNTGDFHTLLGTANCSDITARPAADYDNIVLFRHSIPAFVREAPTRSAPVHQISSNKRAGSSINCLMATKNWTASRPSIKQIGRAS